MLCADILLRSLFYVFSSFKSCNLRPAVPVTGREKTMAFALVSSPAFGNLSLAGFIAGAVSVGIGELISCTVLGVLLVKIIESSKALNELFAAE